MDIAHRKKNTSGDWPEFANMPKFSAGSTHHIIVKVWMSHVSMSRSFDLHYCSLDDRSLSTNDSQITAMSRAATRSERAALPKAITDSDTVLFNLRREAVLSGRQRCWSASGPRKKMICQNQTVCEGLIFPSFQNSNFYEMKKKKEKKYRTCDYSAFLLAARVCPWHFGIIW